jgi:hypothetical protein
MSTRSSNASDQPDATGGSGAGSITTMISVAIVPTSSDTMNQVRPLRRFDCASPALIRASVNQPTARSPQSPGG